MTKTLQLACAGLFLMGCASDPVDRYISQIEGAADDMCATCPELTGAGATEADCRATITASLPTATEQDCLRRVYADNSAELNPVADCTYEAQEAFLRCVRIAIATCPPSSDDLSVCGAQLSAANERCPLPSAATAADLEACTPE